MRIPGFLTILPLLAALQTAVAQQPETDLAASARMLAQRALIVDTHIDVPYRLQEAWVDVSRTAEGRDFDYERARLGGLDLPFMSIYTPAELEAQGGSFKLANQLIDSVEAIVGRAPEKFALARTTQEARRAQERGLIGLALGMENGSPLEDKLENLKFFYDRGVRYITLAHSLSNHLADSSYDENRLWNGLSPFGRQVVTEMNRLGIMVDISHVSDAAFYQVLEISTAPVIASHSSARFFTPGFERNMSDDMIQALARNGGVIQVNFGSTFLTKPANDWSVAMREARKAWVAETGFSEDSDEGKAWETAYRQQFPLPYASVADVADHIDHIVALAGVDHVGIGSDFDGVGDSLPVGLKDVSGYPALIEELLRRGYQPEQVERILGGNLMRVWAAVEAAAEH
jgi:membrane dipeptidase